MSHQEGGRGTYKSHQEGERGTYKSHQGERGEHTSLIKGEGGEHTSLIKEERGEHTSLIKGREGNIQVSSKGEGGEHTSLIKGVGGEHTSLIKGREGNIHSSRGRERNIQVSSELNTPHIHTLTHTHTQYTEHIPKQKSKQTNKNKETWPSHLNGRLLKVANVGSGLSRFLAQRLHPGVCEPKCIYNHFPCGRRERVSTEEQGCIKKKQKVKSGDE